MLCDFVRKNINHEEVNMFKLGHLGFASLFGGFLLLLFQVISSVTNKGFILKKLKLVDILEPGFFDWAEGITFFHFNIFLNYVLNLQLFVLLFFLAVIFFILSGILEKKW